MCNHLDGVERLVGHVALGICISFWSSACVFTLGCILGLGTVVLGYVSLSCCSMFVSIYPGGFSAVTDVSTDNLTSFHNRSTIASVSPQLFII